MRKIQTLGVLGVTPADPRAGTPSHTRHSPWVLSLRVADAQARACTNPASHLPATRHSFDPQPDLSLGAGKTRENTETGCASNRNIPKTGKSADPCSPYRHCPANTSPVPGSTWKFPAFSGRAIPGFNPLDLPLRKGHSQVQSPRHDTHLQQSQLCPASLSLTQAHWIITEKTKANPNFSAIIKQRGGIHYLAAVNIQGRN